MRWPQSTLPKTHRASDIILDEESEQKTLMAWAQHHPICRDYLWATPNGGYRPISVAKKMKQTGVKKGVPDLFLAFPFNNYCGLFIEMKKKKGGRLQPEQQTMITLLQSVGYKVVVAYGWEQAMNYIEQYLGK